MDSGKRRVAWLVIETALHETPLILLQLKNNVLRAYVCPSTRSVWPNMEKQPRKA